MSRKDLQALAKIYGLKGNAKNALLISQLLEISQKKRNEAQPEVKKPTGAKKNEEKVVEQEKEDKEVKGFTTKVPKKVAVKKSTVPKKVKKPAEKDEKEREEQTEPKKEMEIEETKLKSTRGTKRVGSNIEEEETKPKSTKLEETPEKFVKQEPPKDFQSPLVKGNKFHLASATRSFLTPVKNTPSKTMITPRSSKPTGKILPKNPIQFNIEEKNTIVDTKRVDPEKWKSVRTKLNSLKENTFSVSSFELYTVGVVTAPRLISTGALKFVSSVIRDLLINLCSYAIAENEEKSQVNFQNLKNALAEIFPEGEIHSQAVRESIAARDRYIKFKDDDEYETIELKSGLTFIIGETTAMLEQLQVDADILFTIGATAVFEYICAEIFNLCPSVNVGEGLVVSVEVAIASIKEDQELSDLLNEYVKEECDLIEIEKVKQEEIANNLIIELKKNKSWIKNGAVASEDELKNLEGLSKKLPVQLKSLLLAQNGNISFGIDEINKITAEYESQSLDLLNILEFIILKICGEGQYDCLDSLTGLVIRITIPVVADDSGSFPVVANSLLDYVKKFISGKGSPKFESSTLGQVNKFAAEVCGLFKTAREQEVANST